MLTEKQIAWEAGFQRGEPRECGEGRDRLRERRRVRQLRGGDRLRAEAHEQDVAQAEANDQEEEMNDRRHTVQSDQPDANRRSAVLKQGRAETIVRRLHGLIIDGGDDQLGNAGRVTNLAPVGQVATPFVVEGDVLHGFRIATQDAGGQPHVFMVVVTEVT